MPPKRAQKARNSTEQEGRILLAIKAIKNDEFMSIRQAARVFTIPESTLRDRLRGRTFYADIRANSHKLTKNEEISLYEWIIPMDDRGSAPRPSMVADMANLLPKERGETPITTVGRNWATNFVNDTLPSKHDIPGDIITNEWFDRVQNTILKYGITPADIFNFDETGFAMGLTATAKVITRAEYHGRRALLQPGNREWVTVIKCICCDGYALPPYIIFKNKILNLGWAHGLPSD
ncbi:hypothetical protein N7520_002564 [Penicillium odoratum]|uniref:uncharacterized protein n=1 Tax=Penicillium odoratum TaxID=1167516 RepID=UPI002547962B|nr:uncharacterized protein N7520_002564 [Penicillium odoratum]KAJ5772035.1 hypothetical protein N7520_002564 [Penicillium odoratum]